MTLGPDDGRARVLKLAARALAFRAEDYALDVSDHLPTKSRSGPDAQMLTPLAEQGSGSMAGSG
jgi:hypothetical protein